MNTRVIVLDSYDEIILMWKGQKYLTIRPGIDLLPILLVGPMSHEANKEESGIIKALREEGL